MDGMDQTNAADRAADRSGSTAAIVQTGLQDTADTARELARTIERGADTLENVSRTAGEVTEKVEHVAQKVSDVRGDFESRVREHPLAAAAAATALGLLVGLTR